MDSSEEENKLVEINAQTLEFALSEIFNFYSRKFSEKTDDFEKIHQNLF